jgi:hypothetical protein
MNIFPFKRISMKLKSILAVVAVTAGIFSANAEAMPLTWTVSSTGTISFGYDNTGVFGTAGRDLTGLPYIQVITASTDPSQWDYSAETVNSNNLVGAGPGFVVTVTVDGHTVTFNAPKTNFGEQFVSYSPNPDVGQDNIYSYQRSDGLYAFNSGFTYKRTVMSNSFDQSATIAGGSHVEFGVSRYPERQQASFTSYTLGVTTANGDVPEPASIALLSLGMFSMASLRLRKAS